MKLTKNRVFVRCSGVSPPTSASDTATLGPVGVAGRICMGRGRHVGCQDGELGIGW